MCDYSFAVGDQGVNVLNAQAGIRLVEADRRSVCSCCEVNKLLKVFSKNPGIIGGSCSASALASAGAFKGKLRVKWLWLITRFPSFIVVVGISRTRGYDLRVLFEHLLDGLGHHLRVFATIVAQRILSNPSPCQ